MKKIIVYYSVANGGDGSADPCFFNSQEQADEHQDRQSERGNGWADHCTGTLEITIHEGGKELTYSIRPEMVFMEEEDPWDDVYRVDPDSPAVLEKRLIK